ncbi:MAG TPA: hypothetical protein VLB27_05585, partial [candidate division Zixibacteria bacterium]|nr:hypothetical protein [candidate division Zixibacteria bacterium]
MLKKRSLSWWYWVPTVDMLGMGVISGWATAFHIAIAITLVQFAHYAWRTENPLSFPAQHRLAYLALLLIGQIPGLQALYWVPLITVSTLLLFGYCPLARALSLAPWNRNKALNWRVIQRAFTAKSERGAELQGLTELSQLRPAATAVSVNAYSNLKAE